MATMIEKKLKILYKFVEKAQIL
uniref:Uncharacterized protein n=1 Tax=Rhizophora mucronata TaxID=61149 RepID=A0A2P2Q8T5_RHIMU